MFNWFKKKGQTDIPQKENPQQKVHNALQNQDRNKQQGNNNVTGNIDLGSCTLANMIHNLMPKDFLPQLNQAKIGFKDNVVTIGIGNHTIEIICKELEIQLHGQFIAGSYSIITKLDNGKELYEEVPGYGNEALKVYYGAAQNYISGFLLGYLAAIFGLFDEGYALQNNTNDMWHVSLGNYLLQGKLQEMEISDGQLFDIILPKLNDFKSKMKDEIYGIKIYMCQVNGNEFIGDCRIDNVEWQEGINELKDKDYSNWVHSNDLMSKKQWIFLKKCKKEN